LTIKGERHSLWRAVDQDDNGLDILVQSRRNNQGAKKFLRKWLKRLQDVPRVLMTEKLKSYGAAQRALRPGVEHRQSRYLNTRCENSHRPTCQRACRMQGLKSAVRVGPHGPTLPPPTASVVRVGVPRRDAKPLRELGRNDRDKAGGLSAGSVSIEPKVPLLLSGDGINPNNLTMPIGLSSAMLSSILSLDMSRHGKGRER